MVKSHYFHTPLDYEILEKGERYVRIRPLKIGYGKANDYLVTWMRPFGDRKYHSVRVNIDEYDFWIKRKYLVRGPYSNSNTKNRYVWEQGFGQMMLNAYFKKLSEMYEEDKVE